jgi:hypothetical protein
VRGRSFLVAQRLPIRFWEKAPLPHANPFHDVIDRAG